MLKIGILDTCIFIGYFVVVTFIGFFVGRKKKESARDYFIASGKLSWYLIGFGLIASSISTEQFVACAGFTYKWGLAVLNWELSNIIALLVLLWIFIPIYLSKKIVTMPSYLEKRFGPGPRNLYAVISILSAALVLLPGVMYTGGFLLEQTFGINKYIAIWTMALIAGLYTVYGGMISVVWTQLLQGVLLLGSGILVFVLGVVKVDGGLKTIIWPAGEAARSHLILPASHPELPWTAMLVLATCVNIWYWCTNQSINQSCLGAKTRWDAKMGIILVGFMMLLTTTS